MPSIHACGLNEMVWVNSSSVCILVFFFLNVKGSLCFFEFSSPLPVCKPSSLESESAGFTAMRSDRKREYLSGLEPGLAGSARPAAPRVLISGEMGP